MLVPGRPDDIVREKRRLDRPHEPRASSAAETIEDGDVRGLRAECDPEAQAVRAQREVARRPGNVRPARRSGAATRSITATAPRFESLT